MTAVEKPSPLAPFQLFEQLDKATVSIGKNGGRRYTIEGKEMSLNALYSMSRASMDEARQPAKIRDAVLTKLNELDIEGNQTLKTATSWQRLLTAIKHYLTLSPLIRAIQRYHLKHVETRESTALNMPNLASLNINGPVPSKETFRAMQQEASSLAGIMLSEYGYGAGHPDYQQIASLEKECVGAAVVLEGPFPLSTWDNQEWKNTLQANATKALKVKERLEKWTSTNVHL